MSDQEEQKSYYVKDGKQFPRVTHILKTLHKPGLDRWRGRLGNQEADAVAREGSRIGTEFHEIAAQINRGEHLRRGWQPPGEFRFMVNAYVDWLHKYIARVELFESTFFSEEHDYAGTVDLLAVIRGDEHPSIIDIKTSNQPSLDWPLQLSAYRRMVRESGIEVARRVIVRIPKKGTITAETFDYADHEADDEAWLKTIDLWHWLQGEKQRTKDALVVAGL